MIKDDHLQACDDIVILWGCVRVYSWKGQASPTALYATLARMLSNLILCVTPKRERTTRGITARNAMKYLPAKASNFYASRFCNEYVYIRNVN